MNILFCDDEPIILELYISELEAALPHFNFFRATNGVEALEVFKKESISYVFTDGKMPVMDGVELTKNLMKLENPPTVYMITGYAGTYDEDTLKKEGIKKVFYKPLDYDWLTEFVGNLK